jgi:flagellar basal-body rod modification protein FlgD
MYINGMSAQTATSSSGSTANNAASGLGEDTTQTFLTLLMAQLKTQDPLSPMDPNQMVTQLVQFNSLGQLMSIRQLLEQQTDAAKDTAQAAAGGQ